MEALENCVENGKCIENADLVEHQYDAKEQILLESYNDLDNKSFDFEAHFNGNGPCSGDDYDENDDGSFGTR